MTRLDRPAAIRHALRDLVAERGFHGASMGAVAKRAGVAAGTAYVHYESKDELVYATYVEIKTELATAVLAKMDLSGPPADAWRHLIVTGYAYLREEPARAGFLNQLEVSPYYETARDRLLAVGDPLGELGQDERLRAVVVDLPKELISALSFGVVVRLVAGGAELSDDQLETLVQATWRAITRP